MKLSAELPSLTGEGIFSVDVDYEVVLKQVSETIYNGATGASEDFYTFSYSDHMTLIHYDDFTNIHLVQLTSDDDDSHITYAAGSGTQIYNTDYPGIWKVVIGSSIAVTADAYYEIGDEYRPRLYEFDRLETSFWIEGRLRLFPIVTTSRVLTYYFDPNIHYYSFNAEYVRCTV